VAPALLLGASAGRLLCWPVTRVVDPAQLVWPWHLCWVRRPVGRRAGRWSAPLTGPGFVWPWHLCWVRRPVGRRAGWWPGSLTRPGLRGPGAFAGCVGRSAVVLAGGPRR